MFFDSIDRAMLMEMLRERVADKSILRLIGKCLHVGVLDGDQLVADSGVGTVQGSALSPLLGNVTLHHVLDVWFEREVLPRLRGRAQLVRFADDFVITLVRVPGHRDHRNRSIVITETGASWSPKPAW